MNPATDDPLDVVRHYHQRTKHRPERYAASLGYLDWATQPDPFRRFDGAPTLDLPRPSARPAPSYDSLFATAPAPAALDADTVGRLLLHSLALSAWKQAGPGQAWSLRINPSSGALHPTEGYLISGPVPGLIDAPGLFHYAPFSHQLERRATLSAAQWATLTADLPQPCLLVGLTSIHWREAWKYGERAWRYCQHDAGHAIGAIAFAARTLGWQARVIDTVADIDLARLLGTDRQSGPEAEQADALLLLTPAGPVGPLPGAEAWPRFTTNRSERFEARFSQVEVLKSPSLFFDGLAGSRLPIAVSHGEGQANFSQRGSAAQVIAAMRFVDDRGEPTEVYPFNPNGSPGGLTAVTTADGRFTAMMPHPERVFRRLQMSWVDPSLPADPQGLSPWIRLWRNARRWVG